MRGLKFLVICSVVLGTGNAYAGDYCRYSKDLAASMDLRGIDRIEVLAVSGDLQIQGSAGVEAVSAVGRACVEKQFRDRLGEFRIIEERDGALLRIIAFVPYRGDDDDWRVGGLDLTLTVPDSLPMTVADSSGDIEIENVASLTLNDSSGDIRLRNIKGRTLIERDSSGDIDIRGAGEVAIQVDSSGDIDVSGAASLFVGKDSSGSIDARDIRGDVLIGADSSGDVRVSDVGGSFTVKQDGSGEIRHQRVAGIVDIPPEY